MGYILSTILNSIYVLQRMSPKKLKLEIVKKHASTITLLQNSVIIQL